MMDGCYVHKRFDGQAGEIEKPLLQGSLFFDPPSQCSDLSSYSPGDECRDFRSGNILQKQQSFCDISGIFGAVCIHGLVFGLMNIAKGESLAYSVEMIHQLRKFIPRNKLVISYDIYCKIKGRVEPNMVDGGFVSEMHSFNHNDSCRSITCPKRLLGFGFEDGEDCERFWSHIRSIAYLTSVMRVENREDVLSLVCIASNESSTFRLVSRIHEDLKKCASNLNLLKVSVSDGKLILGVVSLLTYEETQVALRDANGTFKNKSLVDSSDKFSKLIKKVTPPIKDLTNLRIESRNQSKFVNLFLF